MMSEYLARLPAKLGLGGMGGWEEHPLAGRWDIIC